MLAKVSRLTPSKVIFFNCDIQTKFMDYVIGKEGVISVAKNMAQIAQIFNIPFVATEQHPKAFGPTCEELKQLFPKNNFFFYEKTSFSMFTKEVHEFIKSYPERNKIVLYGTESHVCVNQTCLDLLENNYTVHILTDGISSIKMLDRSTAFKNMERNGAYLTTSESAIFELMRDYTHKDFKKVLEIAKQRKNILDTL